MKETSRHLEAFEAWYASGRNWSKTAQKSSVSRRLLYDWADRFDWHDRADARDLKARKRADIKAVEEKAKRLEDQRKTGTVLRQIATNHFIQKDDEGKIIPYEFESTSAAISVLKEGVAMERQADGLPDYVLMAINADENQIQRKRDEIFAELERRAGRRGGADSLPDGDGPSGGDDE